MNGLLPEELPEGRLLLHVCCAPCCGAIVEALAAAYQEAEAGVGEKQSVPAAEQGAPASSRFAIFWSNSNIYERAEYDKRKAEVLRYAAQYGIEVIDDDYDHSAWTEEVACGREDSPERGARCLECFRFRLLRAARYAAGHGFSTLTTSLASSRWKSLEQVDEAGRWACAHAGGVQWWGRNWRKGGLQPRRNEIIREQNFYNQTFCGCEYSDNSYICKP